MLWQYKKQSIAPVVWPATPLRQTESPKLPHSAEQLTGPFCILKETNQCRGATLLYLG